MSGYLAPIRRSISRKMSMMVLSIILLHRHIEGGQEMVFGSFSVYSVTNLHGFIREPGQAIKPEPLFKAALLDASPDVIPVSGHCFSKSTKGFYFLVIIQNVRLYEPDVLSGGCWRRNSHRLPGGRGKPGTPFCPAAQGGNFSFHRPAQRNNFL